MCEEPFKFLHDLPNDLKATIIDVQDSRVVKIEGNLEELKNEVAQMRLDIDNGPSARAANILESSYQSLLGAQLIGSLLLLTTFNTTLIKLIGFMDANGVGRLKIVSFPYKL